MNENDQNGWLKAVDRESLSKTVLQRIKEAMIRKELRPGDSLPSESELSSKLGVGKSSVREALKMLEAMGVIEIKKGQNSVVCNTVHAEILNPLIFELILQNENNRALMELRTMFETSASLVAMNNATHEDLEKIKRNIEGTEEKIHSGLPTTGADMDFHTLIYESTHNPFIISIGRTIMELFRASIEKSNENIPETVLNDHKNIFKSFQIRDGEALKAAIARSLEEWNQYSLNS